MEKPEAVVLPKPPSLMESLMAGFDTIAAHISLIIFPVVLDLFLWLGPHLRLEPLARYFAEQTVAYGTLEGPEAEQMLQANKEMWTYLGEHYNLLSLLRSIPVGLPSLMSGKWPVGIPAGLPAAQPAVIDISSFLVALLAVPVLIFIGLVAGALYYRAVVEAVMTGEVRWGRVLRQWPWDAAQVVLLGAAWHILIIAVSVPSLCFLSALLLGGASLGRLGVLVFAGILLWMLFPLVFSAHGIFVHRNNVFTSITRGVRIIRMTMMNTGLFFVMILIISEGLEILWQVPEDNSWFTLLGIFGHAFVTTGLLAASFVYYKKADDWVQSMLIYWKQPPAAPKGY